MHRQSPASAVFAQIPYIALLLAVLVAAGCTHTRTYQEAPAKLALDGGELARAYCTEDVLVQVAESACDAGDGFGCAVAASTLDAGRRELALDLAEDGCDQGSELSCAVYMRILFDGEHDEREEAVEQFKGMCQDRQGLSCLLLGRAYEISEREVKDRRVAVGLYKRACDQDLAEGCRRFAAAYQRGFGVSYNPKRARHYLERACELGDAASCKAQTQGGASAGAQSRLDQADLSRDFARMLDQGCSARFPSGCALAGVWAKHADDSSPDLAERLFERGCSLGDQTSCALAGESASAEAANACTSTTTRASLESVLDDLPALYVEQTGVNAVRRFEQMCEQGNAWACGKAGYRYDEAMGVPVDDKKARALYIKSCHGDIAWACSNLALMFDRGEGGPERPRRARVLYKEACSDGATMACNNLGVMLKDGDGGEQDFERAAELFEDACDEDVELACHNLGELYRDGQGVAKDLEQASAYFRKSCEMGKGVACDALADLLEASGDEAKAREAVRYMAEACKKDRSASCRKLGKLYLQGRGVEASPQAAMAYFMKGCHGRDAKSCRRAVELFEQGLIEQVDDHTVETFARRVTEAAIKSCDEDDGYECARAGYLTETGFGVDEDFAAAAGYYRRGCELGAKWGCRNLGHLLRDGKGVDKNTEAAANFYEKACEQKDEWGCFELASAYYTGRGRSRDYAKAAALYRETCERDNTASCVNLASIYLKGHGVEENAKEALRLAKEACDADHSSGCFMAGDIYDGGHGVEQDKQAGLGYFERACELGNTRGCLNATAGLVERSGTPEGKRRLREFLEKSCDKGSVHSCATLAEGLRHGRYMGEVDKEAAAAVGDQIIEIGEEACRKDRLFGCTSGAMYMAYGLGTEDAAPQKAAAMLEKACARGSRSACATLAREQASGGYVERDRVRAQATFERQCSEGRSISCCNAGTTFYFGGETAADFTSAARAFEQSCGEGNAVSCRHLAHMSAKGLGTDKDRDRAVELITKSCNGFHRTHCVSRAELQWHHEPRRDELAQIYQTAGEACDDKYSNACILQAKMMEAGAGTSVDMTGAKKLYTIACKVGRAEACARLDALERVGQSTFGDTSPKTALEACEAGDDVACLAAGLSLERDYSGAERMTRAGSAYRKACERDDPTACVLHVEAGADERGVLAGSRLLGHMAKTCALGPKKFCGDWSKLLLSFDHELGVEVARRACKEGHKWSCQKLEDLGERTPEQELEPLQKQQVQKQADAVSAKDQ